MSKTLDGPSLGVEKSPLIVRASLVAACLFLPEELLERLVEVDKDDRLEPPTGGVQLLWRSSSLASWKQDNAAAGNVSNQAWKEVCDLRMMRLGK